MHRCARALRPSRDDRRCRRPWWIAAAVLGLWCMAGTSSAGEDAPDNPWIGIVSYYDKREGVTWHESEQDYLTAYDFRAWPAIGTGDDGRMSLALRAARKSDKGIGLKSLEIRVDGASSTFPLKRVDIDRRGCRVVEKFTLNDQEALVRSIAAAQVVEFVVTGILSTDTHRLNELDFDDFRRMVSAHDRPKPPEHSRPPEEASPPELHATNPELIPSTKVDPIFPLQARKKVARGLVIMQAIIHKDGSLGDIKLLRSTACDCGFEAAAMSAVTQWRYKPATQNGKPVDVYFTIEVSFVE